VTVQAQRPLEFANEATPDLRQRYLHRAVAQNSALLDRLQLDHCQMIGAQCSGALLMARLGLLADMPAALTHDKPWLIEPGCASRRAVHARGPIATRGCLAAQYLAAWMMVRGVGYAAAAKALHHVAPMGEKEAYVARLLEVVRPFIPADQFPPAG